MEDKMELSAEALKERTIHFYMQYAHEIEYVKGLLALKLKEGSIVYTIENNLTEYDS